MTLELLDGRSVRRIDGVHSVVAADGTGLFGLMPGHAALVTVLEPCLLRYRCGGLGSPWRHAACVGGLLRGADNHISIVSPQFLIGDDPDQLQDELDHLLEDERELRFNASTSPAQLEQMLLQPGPQQRLARSS